MIIISLQELSLKFLCGTKIGSTILNKLASSNFSIIVGKFLDSRFSKLLIFLEDADLSQYEKRSVWDYDSYNDFFIRRKPDSEKPFLKEGIYAPAAGYLSIFDADKTFKVKNIPYTIKDLLQDDDLAAEFSDSYIAIVRLTTAQEHRYGYCSSGNLLKNKFINGLLYSVHPINTENTPVYATNQRSYTVIETEDFGKVIQMEVGALCVGKIINYKDSGLVTGGMEKGYFAYGGSSIVMIVQKDKASLACDRVYEKFIDKGFQLFKKEANE